MFCSYIVSKILYIYVTYNTNGFHLGVSNLSAIYGWKYNVTGKRYLQTDETIVDVVNHQSEPDMLCE